MFIDDNFISDKAKNHKLHLIRCDYVQLLEDSLSDLNKIVKEYWQISMEDKLIVLSYLSCVKYRFSFWDFMIDEMKAQVFVESPYNKNSEYKTKEIEKKFEDNEESDLIEGPIASIYQDRSLYNLNYFLHKGANPLEARSWGLVTFDIEMDAHHGIVDSAYLDCLYDQFESNDPPELLDREIFKYNLTQEQLKFLEYIDEKFYLNFTNNIKKFFKQFMINDLEQLSLEYSQLNDYKRIFLAEFVQWNQLDFMYFADNIFELALGKLFLELNYTLSCLHLLRRGDQVRLNDLLHTNVVNKKYSKIEIAELNIFYLELHYLVEQAQANTTNLYILQSLEFYSKFIDKDGQGIKFQLK